MTNLVIIVLIIVCVQLYYRVKVHKEIIRLQKETIANKDATIKAYKSILKNYNVDIQ